MNPLQVNPRIAIVGATGAVGDELLKLLISRRFPFSALRCFASEKSVGKTLHFDSQEIVIEKLEKNSFIDIDIALFTAGSSVAKQYAPFAKESGCIVIDNSSAFRGDDSVPLLIPEINAHALEKHQNIIASPNCTTTIMLLALAPLHRLFPIKRIVAATYQAASGAGKKAMSELEEASKAYLENRPFSPTVFPFPYAFNLFAHTSPLLPNGYVEEEMKMVRETRKILEDESIQIHATCIRVPVLRTHSEALNVEFHERVTVEQAYEILSCAPGVKILENREQNRFPMPIDAIEQNDIYCGRIREDQSQKNTLDIWVVGDQLLKGAALNMIQIAELILAAKPVEIGAAQQ
ncbi:MAG: aspartate-semialdehyde dehydrogenase [Chlamydiae bacterium]|nr:aspartate-semialdehyde dehydrogenase [Chlamydiota bacterium]